MSKPGRILIPLSAVAGAALAALMLSTTARADACDQGECSLVSGGDPTDVGYQGTRPLFTIWEANQPTNVEVTAPGEAPFVAGGYDVAEKDLETPLLDSSTYNYGNFVPAATNPAGIDSGGLSGAQVADITYRPGDGPSSASGVDDFMFNNLSIKYTDGSVFDVTTIPGKFTNIFDYSAAAGGSGDWILMPGQTTPTLLWDALFTPTLPPIPDDGLPPDVFFPDLNSEFPPDLL